MMNANNSQIFFAAHAPTDIPEWFEHTPPTDIPEFPHASKLPEKVRKLAADWVDDPCYDLDLVAIEEFGPGEYAEILIQFEKDWKAASKALKEWRRRNQRTRYFQWRLYYAEQMANSFETLGMFAEAFPR